MSVRVCVCVTYICICICNVISLRNFVAAGVLAKYAEKTAEKRRGKKDRCYRGGREKETTVRRICATKCKAGCNNNNNNTEVYKKKGTNARENAKVNRVL